VEWKRGGRLTRFTSVPGNFMLLAADVENSFHMDRPTQTLNISFGNDALRSLVEREWDSPGASFEITQVCQQCTPEIVALAQALAPHVLSARVGSRLYAETLWTQLAIQVLWNFSTLPRDDEALAERLPDVRLRRVVEYLDGSLASEISLVDLADLAGLSPNYFLSAFKKATGHTPHRFLTEKRIAKACELLANPQVPIAAVALAVGFSSQSHFTTVFRRFRNTTPALFRAQLLGLDVPDPAE
jgi:AraC family transcriptional regulator